MIHTMDRRQRAINRGKQIAEALDKLHIAGEVYAKECTTEKAALRVMFRDGKFRTLTFLAHLPGTAEDIAESIRQQVIAWK